MLKKSLFLIDQSATGWRHVEALLQSTSHVTLLAAINDETETKILKILLPPDHSSTETTIFLHLATSKQQPPVNNGHKFWVPKVNRLLDTGFTVCPSPILLSFTFLCVSNDESA